MIVIDGDADRQARYWIRKNKRGIGKGNGGGEASIGEEGELSKSIAMVERNCFQGETVQDCAKRLAEEDG
tara:strand:+ start:214 stop:423 length:210 start_codon:yes stop_codon:yes gene_type:complete